MAKGIINLIIVAIIALVFAFSILIGNLVLTEFADKAGPMLADTTPLSIGQQAYGALNIMFVVLMGGAFIAVVISSFQVETHPVFFVASLLVMIILVMIGAVFTNIYHEVVTSTALSATGSEYTFMNAFFENLPRLFLFFSGVIAIVQFSKLRRGFSHVSV